MSTIIDAYGHVSLPRFASVEDFLTIMEANGIEKAILATAETCPDLAELSRAIVTFPDKFRAIGMPLGGSISEIEDCVCEQMASGFSGIRLPAPLVASQPQLLDIIGQAGGSPFIVGENGLSEAADILIQFLDRYPDCFICAPHFAGVTDPAIFIEKPIVHALFSHPRFMVIFSRQGAQNTRLIKQWTQAVLNLTGWGRVLFGSESPVSLWRDETYASTMNWVEKIGLELNRQDRQDFFYENSFRLFFAKPARPVRPIVERWCHMQGKKIAPVWLFPQQSLDLPEEAHRKILTAYLHQGGDRQFGSYRAFVTQLIMEAAEDL